MFWDALAMQFWVDIVEYMHNFKPIKWINWIALSHIVQVFFFSRLSEAVLPISVSRLWSKRSQDLLSCSLETTPPWYWDCIKTLQPRVLYTVLRLCQRVSRQSQDSLIEGIETVFKTVLKISLKTVSRPMFSLRMKH